MAYHVHNLITMGGRLNEKAPLDEIWQFGVRVTDTAGDELEESEGQAVVDHLGGLMTTVWVNSNSRIASSAVLEWVKIDGIGADGKSNWNQAYVHDLATPLAGPSAAAVPSFLSVCLSWTTARKRPPGAFGRIFPPNYGCTILAGTSKVGSGDITAQVAWAQGLLDAIGLGNGSDRQLIPVIASKTNATNTPITGVRVGDVYDVHRSRKNAVAEVYAAAPFPG